jgi:serine/threonine protein kinase
MEYCEFSLDGKIDDLRNRNINFNIKQIKKYSYQILTGLERMHKIDVVHRDLKPENILLKEDSIRIADFGAAKVIGSSFSNPYAVTRYYRAPELHLISYKYDSSIDMWSFGCILFEIITFEPLFAGEAESTQILEI